MKSTTKSVSHVVRNLEKVLELRKLEKSYFDPDLIDKNYQAYVDEEIEQLSVAITFLRKLRYTDN